MKDISNRNFGLLIAHIVPGFIALWGLQDVSPTVRLWMSAASTASDLPTVGGFLYVTLASVALGMTVGAIRWCLIDWAHHHTGLPRPAWDDSRLQANLEAFDLIVEHHYRYYQFHANTIVSLIVVYVAHRWSYGFDHFDGVRETAILLLSAVFWATSRSNLHRYYTRVTALMTTSAGKLMMSNGSHPESKPKPTPKPAESESAEKTTTAPK